MQTNEILEMLNQSYNLDIKSVELFREGGNLAYIIYDKYNRFFLKVIRPPFIENALSSINIQLYLMKNQFPVCPIILTNKDDAYIKASINDKEQVLILYEYIEGKEPDPENTERVGALIGNLHNIMRNYAVELTPRRKFFFIERYLMIMKNLKYDKLKDFEKYGEQLWERVKNLPKGYCHCDLHRGNILQDSSGILRIMDFDTSCNAFPMYDIALLCNDTHYFNFEYDGYGKSKARFEHFLKGYLRYRTLRKDELAAFYDMIAVYHFQIQATMIEIHGYRSVNSDFFDAQLVWLSKWKKQCDEMSKL